MTFREQLEKAAEEYAFELNEVNGEANVLEMQTDADLFKAGAEWALNSEVVRGMREALESVRKTIIKNSPDTLWCHDEVNMTAVEKVDLALAQVNKMLDGEK